MVVEDARGADLLAQVKVLGRCRREDFVARRNGQLDRVRADAGRASPYQQGLAVGLRAVGAWIVKPEVVFLEETRSCRAQAQRQNRGIRKAQVIGDVADGLGFERGVVLECARPGFEAAAES